MKNKPIELKGKAERYEDLLKYSLSYVDFNYLNRQIKSFYKQKFNLDMLEKYFVEWKTFTRNYSITYLNQESDRILFNRKRKITFILYREAPVNFIFPETLSDFITNCLELNINLIWKQNEPEKT